VARTVLLAGSCAVFIETRPQAAGQRAYQARKRTGIEAVRGVAARTRDV
jgi:hypothetical protein